MIWFMRLSSLYPTLTGEQRVSFARNCGISTGYLWQLATRWKGKRPTVDLLAKLAKAHPDLSVGELVDEFADHNQVLSEPDMVDVWPNEIPVAGVRTEAVTKTATCGRVDSQELVADQSCAAAALYQQSAEVTQLEVGEGTHA